MPELSITLAASSFLAGILMFLAPCTLPLVPAYIAFIAGVKSTDAITHSVKRKIMRNSLLYVVGFSTVFILFGVLAGLAGVFVGSLREVLVPLCGILIIMFGLQMLHVLRLERWLGNYRISLPTFLTPGSSTSALVIGAAFALGWTPCVGPILATVLLLAGSSGTVLTGTILLALFSLGLALPFLLVALLYVRATHVIAEHPRFIVYTEIVGGVFLLSLIHI